MKKAKKFKVINDFDKNNKVSKENIERFLMAIKITYGLNTENDAMLWAMDNLRYKRYIYNNKLRTGLETYQEVFINCFGISNKDILVVHQYIQKEKEVLYSKIKALTNHKTLDNKKQAQASFLTIWSLINESNKLDEATKCLLEMCLYD